MAGAGSVEGGIERNARFQGHFYPPAYNFSLFSLLRFFAFKTSSIVWLEIGRCTVLVRGQPFEKRGEVEIGENEARGFPGCDGTA